MPTGMIAGSAKYMNFVDGGAFHYDDDTMPSARKSLMAGTHTRNPIKIAACLAALTELKRICPGGTDCDSGSCLLKQLNEKTKRMVEEINAFFSEKRVPVVIDYFGSLFRIRFLDDPFGMTKELLLILLRMNGVETSPSGNCFLTLTHSDEDIASVIKAMKESINTLIKENFFYESAIIESEQQNEVMPGTANTGTRNSRVIPSTGSGQVEKLRNLIAADLKSFAANGGATWR
jgi:glutamate-1-semialdehyde aminotransferase